MRNLTNASCYCCLLLCTVTACLFSGFPSTMDLAIIHLSKLNLLLSGQTSLGFLHLLWNSPPWVWPAPKQSSVSCEAVRLTICNHRDAWNPNIYLKSIFRGREGGSFYFLFFNLWTRGAAFQIFSPHSPRQMQTEDSPKAHWKSSLTF